MKNVNRKELVDRYFAKPPDKPNHNASIIFICIGIALLFIGTVTIDTIGKLCILLACAIFVFFSFIALSAIIAYKQACAQARIKATNKQLDDWLQEEVSSVMEEALIKLNIHHDDSSVEPMMIIGQDEQSKIVTGTDEVTRYNIHDILVFILTEHLVAMYQCIIDLSTGKIIRDKTTEFAFNDITNLEIETAAVNSTRKSDKDVNSLIMNQKLSIYTSGSYQISIRYHFHKSIDNDPNYTPATWSAEGTIKAIRKRLKEYKDKFSTTTID